MQSVIISHKYIFVLSGVSDLITMTIHVATGSTFFGIWYSFTCEDVHLPNLKNKS